MPVPPPRRLSARYRARGRHRSPQRSLRVAPGLRRTVLIAATALMCLGAVAAGATTAPPPASSQADAGPAEAAAGRDAPTASPSRTQPSRTAPSRASRTRQEPPPGKLAFGAEPLRYVQQAAAAAVRAAGCTVTAAQATALTLAPTWPETSPSGQPPSPMTLSRYDVQRSLADPLRRSRGLFFHPGVGPWQLDSAGIGAGVTAGEAMDTKLAAERMAPYLVGKYCEARQRGWSEYGARASAWRDWYACRGGACESAYRTVLRGGVVPVDGVGRYGGGQPRQCAYRGQVYPCLFVDPAAAEGANWWTGSRPGAAPAPVPFYVFRVSNGGRDHEVRYWLASHSGSPVDVSATRPLGANARGGLRWLPESALCDQTANLGRC